jgi:hypothetical protein
LRWSMDVSCQRCPCSPYRLPCFVHDRTLVATPEIRTSSDDSRLGNRSGGRSGAEWLAICTGRRPGRRRSSGRWAIRAGSIAVKAIRRSRESHFPGHGLRDLPPSGPSQVPPARFAPPPDLPFFGRSLTARRWSHLLPSNQPDVPSCNT